MLSSVNSSCKSNENSSTTLRNSYIMGITVCQKKLQVYISYSAAGERQLFAVKPTLKVSSREHLDAGNRLVTSGNAEFDRAANASIHKLYQWFTETVERLERWEKRIASVPMLSNLYEETFVDSSSREKVQMLEFWKNFDAFMAEKKTEVADTTFHEYNTTERKRFASFLTHGKNRYTTVDEIDDTSLIRFKKYFIIYRQFGAASYSMVVSLFKSFCKYLVRVRLMCAEKFFLVNYHLKRKQHENMKDFALTIEQLQEFHEFEDWPFYIKRNMDYFICNCLLGGLRWDDFKKLNFQEIDLFKK